MTKPRVIWSVPDVSLSNGDTLSVTWTESSLETKNPHAVALGRLGGLSKSPAKVAAVQSNGKKGGRPKKAKAVVESTKGES